MSTSSRTPNVKKSGFADLPTTDAVSKKELILHAAFRLLMEKGYKNTSYSDIAYESNCTRALVQYYYPKKDYFITAFVDRLLEAVDEQVRSRGLMTGSCFADFSITGHLYFNFLLANERLRPLALDLIAYRETSLINIERMEAWQHHYPELDDLDDALVLDAVLFAAGGAHELIYHHLMHDTPIDLHLLLARTISSYALLLGFGQETVDDLLKRPPLDNAVINEANAELLRIMSV